ncbi:MAG: SDR family NAD(P)-dependent oxidoreductase [Methanomicrobiales archaeon]|nr:SDR family NAD(P)-dependent oxidoreductase [Methanomicrobiales archaeon]
MRWDGKKVLVTGAGGFIGSHLVDTLVERGADVTAFVHYNARNDWGMLEERSGEHGDRLRVVLGDITDASSVATAVQEKEIVFHLAALIGIPYSYVAPGSYVNTNVRGTLHVMEACRHAPVERVVHTSTSEVYGTALYSPIDERHPLQAQSPYAASKIGADKIAESYYCSFGLPVATLRPFNTFGPRQSARAVIPTLITQALTSDRVQLGSLAPVRDLTFVEDTVHAFLRMAEVEDAVGRVIHTGTGRGVTIGELASLVLSRVNPDATIVADDERVRPERSEVMHLVCDPTLAGKVLGWKPRVTLEAGLDRTIAWMREHLDAYKTAMYAV